MKVQWEAGDIKAGRQVRRTPTTEVSIIGFDPSRLSADGHWALISVIDGQITWSRCTKDDLAAYLTKAGELPIEVFK